MAARWIALVGVFVTLVIVGVFLGAVIWPPPPPDLAPVVGADGSTTRVARAVGRWQGSGRLSMTGRWQLELDLEGGQIILPFVSAP